MLEMQMDKERAERLRLQELGGAWIEAITSGSLERLEQFCHPDIVSQLLLPKRFLTLEKSIDLVAKYRDWFGTCTNLQLEMSRINQVGERLGIFYRFRLLDQEDWHLIEQQLYCTLKDGRVEKLHLLCSGFQLIGKNAQTAITHSDELAVTDDPVRDDLLEFYADNPGSACAVLTPAIRSKLREMEAGQILEVRVGDTSARQDVEAWCRLSGNLLLKVIDDEGSTLRFFVKKKQSI